MPFNLLVITCFAYVIFLFLVAFAVERRAKRGKMAFLRSPLVYTLSLSIYCTAWTFYGAVGFAARSGIEFLTIYLGPTLVFVGWWLILRKLVRIGRQQRVTSIADLISSRFGKSNLLGVVVTLIAVIAATPYIALQLQSLTQSFAAFAQDSPDDWLPPGHGEIALWVAAGLALFTILFGTRKLDASEQYHGIVTAIAVEAVVKMVALLAVGAFVVWGLAGGVGAVIDKIAAMDSPGWVLRHDRWIGLTVLSAAAVISLPRMFQVMVVENVDESHLATASWAFPLYLFGMSLFILPIAVIGLERMPADTNLDMLVLTLPLAEGQGGLAMLAFLGGFSSATSMVIVETIALATMLSNNVVMPLYLRLRPAAALSGNLRFGVILTRRLAIIGVLALGFAYYRMSGEASSLAAMGLIAFAGMAQFLPALLGGIFWRGGTKIGALAGLVTGFAIWAYTLFLPSFGQDAVISAEVFAQGLFGQGWLRPQALFGTEGMDPLVHSVFWSLSLNTLSFAICSVLVFPGPVERIQSAAFVNAFDREAKAEQLGWAHGQPEPETLLNLCQRLLGEEALTFFSAHAREQGKEGFLPDLTPEFLAATELRLAGSVGAATAHAMISQLFGRVTVTAEDLMAVASETAQILEYSTKLEAQRAELTRTARQLREVNDKLTQLSVQKDAFLSQISHELRTPMTSIRAFSEILSEGDLPAENVSNFGRIIHEEAYRLTRLLDDLLDLSVLENRTVQLNLSLVHLGQMLDKAVTAASQVRPERDFRIERLEAREEIHILTDPDRLVQVFINLISNARKYCDAAFPELKIVVRHKAGRISIDFIDNGKGIPKESRELIFEKFARLSDQMRAGGAGLGLAIVREIMTNLAGSITYLPGQRGAGFRVTLPLRLEPKGWEQA